jgi:toxin ParE1/3/4
VPDRGYRLTAGAEESLLEVLDWSEEHFHEVGRYRYGTLFFQAFDDLADDPDRDEVIWYEYRDRRIGYYHLRHSRLAVPKPDRVKQPRHAILFRTLPDGMVEVVRIAHDAQKLERLLRIALEGDD